MSILIVISVIFVLGEKRDNKRGTNEKPASVPGVDLPSGPITNDLRLKGSMVGIFFFLGWSLSVLRASDAKKPETLLVRKNMSSKISRNLRDVQGVKCHTSNLNFVKDSSRC